MTPIADMIEAMLAQSAPMSAIIIAVRACEMSRTNVPDIHGYEAARKRIYRSKTKGSAKANDVAHVPDMSRTVPDNCCDLKEVVIEEGRSTKKEELLPELIEGPKNVSRGTRLDANAILSDVDLKFSIECGMTEQRARAAWSEFIDYWIAIPGQRGTKLNWSSTWRNRVRELTGKGGKHERFGKNRNAPGGGPRAVVQDAIVAGMAAALRERPDSRLGGNNARGRDISEADDPGNSEKLCVIDGGLSNGQGTNSAVASRALEHRSRSVDGQSNPTPTLFSKPSA